MAMRLIRDEASLQVSFQSFGASNCNDEKKKTRKLQRTRCSWLLLEIWHPLSMVFRQPQTSKMSKRLPFYPATSGPLARQVSRSQRRSHQWLAATDQLLRTTANWQLAGTSQVAQHLFPSPGAGESGCPGGQARPPKPRVSRR